MSHGRRRRSRLFSGSPELLLVSEDIPGIVMPAPPASFPPIEDEDEHEFDLSALHAEEDAEEAEASEGPLRLYIGAPSSDGEETAPVLDAEDDTPIWDVSALAMPEASDEDGGSLDFLDADEDVEDEDVVEIDAAPPPLVMSISTEVSEGMSPPSDWEDSPTVPAQAIPVGPAVIRDTPPPVHLESDGDPVDLPDRLPFADETAAALSMADEDAFLAQDMPTKVDAIMSMGEDEDLGPIENEWVDDAETEFFAAPDGVQADSVSLPPPQLKPEPPRSSPAFRPIPDKKDPPLVPILGLLVFMVVFAAVLAVAKCGDPAPPEGTVDNPIKARPAVPTPVETARPAPSKQAQSSVGFLTVETNEKAIIYVDNVKQGRSPVHNIELPPGNHKIRALTLETGHRQVVTAHVVAGETRRVVLEFQ